MHECIGDLPRLSPGAIRQPNGSVEWFVWAPAATSVELVLWEDNNAQVLPMSPWQGYHGLRRQNVAEGTRYAYQVNGRQHADPASRWQPDGVFGRSAVVSLQDFNWHDGDWNGIAREHLVIYELHVGAFTAAGTFAAVIPRLPELKDLGVTSLEIMPVGQFSGSRNWGYDGVFPFAVQCSYGGPREFQKLVDAAHREGIAVLLDVVYNHLGPEGNVLSNFAPYLTSSYQTPWGDALNFDGPECDGVRHFVLENVRMWIRDFHLDGLRLDAVHAIYDAGARHLLAEIQETAQAVGVSQSRQIHVIAESNQNDPRLIDPQDRHGFGLSALWADDFHHSLRALIAGDQQGYFQDYGDPDQLAKAFNDVFVYDGCSSRHRRRRYGAPAGNRDRTRFIAFIQNHDQVGNRALGDRLSTSLPEAAQRLCCGLLMLSTSVPLLFMGEEYAETHPFPFFCSFEDPGLIAAVRQGRRQEFAELGFAWGDELPDPQSEETFQSAILSWSWPESTFASHLRTLYRDLLQARRAWPPLLDRQSIQAEALQTGDGLDLLIVRRGEHEELWAVANLTSSTGSLPDAGRPRRCILSTEERRYGGPRADIAEVDAILPHELLLFGKAEWRR